MSLKVKVFGTYEEFQDRIKNGETPEENLRYLVPEWSYLAGLIDSGGDIFIANDKKNTSYRLRVTIFSFSEWYVNRLKAVFGGHVSKNSSNLGTYNLIWWNLRAGWILWHIFPHLVLKREQARIALQFLNHIQNHKGKGLLNLEVMELRKSFKDRMRALNCSQRSDT